MKRTTILLALLVFLLVAETVLAMSSTNYALNWFTPLTSGGGGPMSSTNYAVNVTIGQTAIGASTSTNYRVGLGYWYGLLPGGPVYLPLIMR
jgi:hypothetical protein